MQYRKLGTSELRVSAVSMGCWAIGGSWGKVSDEESLATLHAAVDAGINFFDTADVYGDGRSERLVGQLLRERSETLYVATKAGRRLSPHNAEGYNRKNLTDFLDRSLKNLQLERVDLLQLHCPPPLVYSQPEVFGVLSDLKKAGKVREFGVSVETVEEGRKALLQPGLCSIQIIYNLFRQRPAEELFQLASESGVGILARVPLASGLLTGHLHSGSQFSADDHRHFNRKGEAFDVGETFSGVPYETGLQVVEEIKDLLPPGITLAQLALRFILQHPAVSCAIPGGRRPAQIIENARAADLPDLSERLVSELQRLYRERVAPLVHERW